MKAKITLSLIFSIIVGLCLYIAIGVIVSIAIQGNGFNLYEWGWMGLGGFLVFEGYLITTCFMTVLE